MVKLRVTKKKGPPTDSDSDDDYRGSSDEKVYTRPKQSTKKGATRRNVRGRGTANPPGRGRGTGRTSRRQSSSALADGSNPRIDPILIFHILRISWLLLLAQLVTIVILL